MIFTPKILTSVLVGGISLVSGGLGYGVWALSTSPFGKDYIESYREFVLSFEKQKPSKSPIIIEQTVTASIPEVMLASNSDKPEVSDIQPPKTKSAKPVVRSSSKSNVLSRRDLRRLCEHDVYKGTPQCR